MSKDINGALLGHDLFGDPIQPKPGGPLKERFGTPPFSVLNSREGEWQSRKRAWASLGMKSELGRDAAVGGSKMVAGYDEEGNRKTGLVTESDTSIFDPVLCELIYRWWAPDGGLVLDPFAGGSVRGIVAAALGRGYLGIDLREEQVKANTDQWEVIGPLLDQDCFGDQPQWVTGDSLRVLDQMNEDPMAPRPDFLFSCPPYGDLEKYSDDPADLSTMDYPTFIDTYRGIIKRAVDRLKNDRFAAFVVGDFRDKKGNYRGFVPDTIRAFEDAGAHFYNDAILVTPVGSAGMRAPKQFSASRKLVKTHQNLLVFVKGDCKKAAELCRASDGEASDA